ncbi:sensor histidine kinase [Ktedonospora formicarum]|uniref:Circadian input-output histidine kinase CikA n=1 Tax=Ktedonospora formicarum TaxID=2778364 RepID=A0A8J3I5Z6_9CHLR|nr:HAMP domain-containing sensor histidine kinase [Ktedonospora formicarum]GHO45339.1 hypothetical protein KSX_35020 [Ktedonospora formicarum]
MRFLSRSLGAKLIAITTVILLLCLLVFGILSWSLINLYAERGVGHSSSRLPFLLLGLGICVFALGVVTYTLLTNRLFLRPLSRLQNHISTLAVQHSDNAQASQLPTHPLKSDIGDLEHAFSQFTESLEHENQAMVEQMNHLLFMNDAFISTLNLEQLLGEIVARLGAIMRVNHISLQLYGREMPAPWAVAQWQPVESEEPTTNSPFTPPLGTPRVSLGKNVTVYADPNRDITLAATTKMVALSTFGRSHSSNQNNYPIPTAAPTPDSKTAPSRIPRSALRELDTLLAQMVMHKKNIAYREDINGIHQEQGEHWAQLAFDMGYHSVIAVPILLQDQAIGAIMLYTNAPRTVSDHETFLLSTAAIQAAIAIQNTLLFAEVKEKNAALERANMLKSQFLANVTHELRTPLHSIISYGALLLEGYVEGELTPEQEEHIQFVVNRAEDLSRLVDDMLDLSKIEADRIEVKPEVLDLSTCLTEVINQLKPMALGRELYLKLDYDPQLPRILADSQRLRQIALNLVSNALKFTEKGGVTIRCQHLPERAQVYISVSDTGIGISPAALGYIFEAFRQADGSTTRRFGGTGLGLTIARKLVELQGGEMSVESVPGRGTTFAFTLPVAATSAAHAG